jgi:predicted amidohydrolase YtcJ
MSRLLITAGDDGIIISGGRIEAMGKAAALRSPGLAERAHRGSFAAPRHDHHFHPFGYATAVGGLTLKHAGDFAGLADLLRREAAHLAPSQALVAGRLDDEALAEQRLPTCQDLDRMIPDRPVLLYRYCGHVAVANSLALGLAGAGPPDGILREEAIQPVSRAVAPYQPTLAPEVVRRALAGLAAIGIGRMTAIVSAGEPLWCGVEDEIETLLEVAPQVPLDFEVLVIAPDPPALTAAAHRLTEAVPNVSFLGWKEFADGSLGGHTAALHHPYADQPSTSGTLRLDPDHAARMAHTCLDLGGTVAIHAIGDLANDRVLDLYESLPLPGPGRLRIEHASLLSEIAIARMGRLGVTASVQPAFITSEQGWLRKRLGDRAEQAYDLAALAASGVPMVGGTDCPVEAPNPWASIAAAAGPGGLGSEAACRLFGADLEVGGEASFLILDRPPGRADPGTNVEAYYRHGRPVDLEPEMPFR